MRTPRLLGSFATLAATGLLAITPACSSKKSGLMLAITTDMKAPKDVNAVSVTVSTNNTIRHNVVGRVTPQGDILLPATLAIVEPDDPNASIRIRVMAFQERKARVMRDVRTSIPSGGRVSLLRIPLNFVNDGSTQGDLPVGALPAPNPGSVPTTGGPTGGTHDGGAPSGGLDGGTPSADAGSSVADPVTSSDLFDPFLFVPNCPNPEHTWIDGECQDAYIDPNSLPEFDPALVGAGDQPGVCFDTKTCFASAVPLQLGGNFGGTNPPTDGAGQGGPDDPSRNSPGVADASAPNPLPQNLGFDADACTVQLDASVNPANLNIAIVTPDTGECIRPNECYVPIDSGEGGWRLEGNQVKLPSFVCKLVKGKNLRLAYSSGCASKQEANPICAETVNPTGVPDGPSGDGGVPIYIGPVTLLVPEEFPPSIGIDGSGLYLAGASRIARLGLAESGKGEPVPGVPAAKLPWVFGATNTGFVLANGTSTVYTFTGADAQARALALPANVTANSASFVSLVGRILIAATPNGGPGGVYEVIPGETTAHAISASFPFAPGAILDEATVVGPTSTGFAYGNELGQVVFCILQGGEYSCGVTNDVGHGSRADAFALKPNDPLVGYGLFGDAVYRTTSFGQNGSAAIVPIANANVGGLTIDGHYYTHAVAANDHCVFYTSAEGVSMVEDSTVASAGRVLYPAPSADKPVLGVAVGPKVGGRLDGGSPALYFTVFAPLGQGGGLYMMDLPPECQGGSRGIDDAGAGDGASQDDAGVPVPPPDGAACVPPGVPCDDSTFCCSGGFCGAPDPDGGFERLCQVP
jgi:hypothetical protein